MRREVCYVSCAGSLMGVLRSCYRMPRDLGCGFTCLCVRMCIRSLVAGNLGMTMEKQKEGFCYERRYVFLDDGSGSPPSFAEVEEW
ncbi:hypothetical protein EYC84_002695 [Monilinia fructicola]|uniref:Uncharacterized protein n=1 Tax=Monilinia fructicola TaxID=38448 RepID=A0A5M9JRG3_MONFR|nr:hypothetical protein EYC84_002695 [Monilinia fructicola]